MKIITGNTGTNHIMAEDDGALFASIVGAESYVFDVGAKFKATALNSTTIQLADGEGLLQGRHFRTEPGVSDTVVLTECAEGVTRHDLIGVQYKNTANVESIFWTVIQGEAVTGEAVDPDYDAGDLLGGSMSAFFPIYRARLSGASLEGLDPLYKLAKALTAEAEIVVDDVVSANSDNPVSGSAVAAFVKESVVKAIAAIADYDGEVF